METHFETVARRVEVMYDVIARTAGHYGLSPAQLEAVIHEESGGDPDAFPEHPERDGASFGLTQVLLPTARAVGFAGKVKILFEAERNIDLGARYLAQLQHRYKSFRVALVAYNGGPRAAWLAAHGLPAGRAGAYAVTVLALWHLYEDRNLARTAPKP